MLTFTLIAWYGLVVGTCSGEFTIELKYTEGLMED